MVTHDFVPKHRGTVKKKASRHLRSHESYSHSIITVVTKIIETVGVEKKLRRILKNKTRSDRILLTRKHYPVVTHQSG